MKHRLLFLLAAFSLSANPQAWSPFLSPSRAIDWTSAGFTIPAYTINCATQPTLTANSASAAAANTTAVQTPWPLAMQRTTWSTSLRARTTWPGGRTARKASKWFAVLGREILIFF